MSDDTTCRLCRRKWDKHESWCSISVMRKRIEDLEADLKLALELASHPTCDECRDTGWAVYPDTPCTRCSALGEIEYKHGINAGGQEPWGNNSE